jgi:hypothetical protein
MGAVGHRQDIRRLLKVAMVKKVIYSKQAKKVYVEFSNGGCALGITPLQIAESLHSQNMVLASGQLLPIPTASWCG